MTTEQNQPASESFTAGASDAAPNANPGQNAAQNPGQSHRRRRRRRKGKGPAGQPTAQQGVPAEGAQPAVPAQTAQGQSGQNPPRRQHQHQQGQKARSSQNRFMQQKNGSGNGNGQGGGQQRRKNKQRRQAPSFVGPMDHSYRAANGNIADGPPSTIEYRGSNGNGNGNYTSSMQPDSGYAAPSIPIREDAPTRIYCFIEDLFFLAKIQETARKTGVKVAFVKADKEIVARLTEAAEQERPSLIVFDLNNANAKPLTLIPRLKAKLKRGTSIIGFLSHLQGDLKMKATEAGCDTVMPRSAFSQNLPNLLRRYGLDEELEEEALQA